ncbi:TetR/AcrR family transcriptional regulator [Isoptericola sp. NPDC057653]|uniref:TetR/AcrR family transcriptional regulator n=1 Tax=unclassified Isoptericola TaxID=2623355 RepID=UPI003697DF7C
MTGRKRLSADERRDQLMAATVRVLADRGFRAATAGEIARVAGVSKGLLWHYFTDLDDLFATTTRYALTSLTSAAATMLDLDAPAPTVIRSAIHATTELRLTHEAERRAIQEIVLNLRTATGEPAIGPGYLEDMLAAQEAIFRRGQSEGDFRGDLDPRVLAVTYQGMVDGMLDYLDAHPDADADRHAENVAEVFLGGAGAARTDD